VTQRTKSSHEPASAKESTVFVIDDDGRDARDSQQSLPIGGLASRAVGSAHEFCAYSRCRMLQAAWSSISGYRGSAVSNFQAELAEADIRIPIIFMTGHGDIPMSVKAMKLEPSIS